MVTIRLIKTNFLHSARNERCSKRGRKHYHYFNEDLLLWPPYDFKNKMDIEGLNSNENHYRILNI